MGFCKCEGPRLFEQIGSWNGCPLEGGGHTQFYVEKCLDCGGICGFPQSNFDLALKEGTEETKSTLSRLADENEPITSPDRATECERNALPCDECNEEPCGTMHQTPGR